MVGLVLGFQGGYIKSPCFLCLWDSGVDDQHYVRQEWQLRQGLKPGLHNVQSHPPVEGENAVSTLTSQFKKNGELCEGNGQERQFDFLQKVQRITMEEIKPGIFDSPQIREVIKDPVFDEAMSDAELTVRQSLKSVVKNFL